MSSTVFSTGFFAILKTRLSLDESEEFCEVLYDADSPLRINGEGTLVYSDIRDENEGYGLRFSFNENQEDFLNELNRMNISIQENTIYPYHCLWYNCSESYMYNLTKEDYMKRHIIQ